MVMFKELSGGTGHALLAASPLPELAAHGYAEDEYAVGGIVGGTTEAGSAPPVEYVTRMLVRRPRRDEDFNGTVVVEWLNVSSGNDAAPEYSYVAAEVVRGGYAWVGLSAQYTGVEGGDGSVGVDTGPRGLAAKNPERYGGLHHPGDAYCYDLFGQLGRVLRRPDDQTESSLHPLGGLTVRRLLAVGESQSAMALTTYVNRFADEHGAYDGYLIHSRALAGLPLGEVGRPIDISGAYRGEPEKIRSVQAPVFVVQTETDVLTDFRYYLARQPDTDRLRVWEVAGTSHADLVQIGPFEEMLGCPDPVNRGQQQFVLRAALAHLDRWAAGESAPPSAAPLEITGQSGPQRPSLVTDAVGNARGGVRTPCVEVPTEVLSGVVPEPVSRICLLFGSTTALPGEQLADLYRSRADYLDRYAGAVEQGIADGFLLASDREALLADARPEHLPY